MMADEHIINEMLEEANDKYIRLSADFDNFRKTKEKQFAMLIKSAEKKLVLDLLPLVDDLEIILANAPDDDSAEFSYNKLIKILYEHGAEPYCNEKDHDMFDDSLHDAIAVDEITDIPSRHISTVYKRGWRMNGEIIRHAQVIVSK